MAKYVPLYNKIYVEALPEEDNTTRSGLILVNNEVAFQKVRVLAVGDGYYQNAIRIPMDIKVGDVLLIPKTGAMVLVEDKPDMPKKFILPDSEVYCKVILED
jgi:chaperonin GroES